MSQDVGISKELEARALSELRAIAPAGSWILFTPHDGMIVSPDPMDIMKVMATLQAISDRAKKGTGSTNPLGLVGSEKNEQSKVNY